MRVLYTGFKGKNNSSYQLLSQVSGEKVFLTNSFDGLKKDIMGITERYDLVIMLGLDTRLKDMVRIERVANYDGAEERTKIDCYKLLRYMKEYDISCAVSDIPTNYLCNAAFYHMLLKVSGKVVLIHIPSSKNMSEGMVKKIVKCMEKVENLTI